MIFKKRYYNNNTNKYYLRVSYQDELLGNLIYDDNKKKWEFCQDTTDILYLGMDDLLTIADKIKELPIYDLS